MTLIEKFNRKRRLLSWLVLISLIIHRERKLSFVMIGSNIWLFFTPFLKSISQSPWNELMWIMKENIHSNGKKLQLLVFKDFFFRHFWNYFGTTESVLWAYCATSYFTKQQFEWAKKYWEKNPSTMKRKTNRTGISGIYPLYGGEKNQHLNCSKNFSF